MKNGVLPVNIQTFSELVQNCPDSERAPDNILIHGPLPNITPERTQPNDEEMGKKAGIKIKDLSGPSGIVAQGWRKIFNFKALWNKYH